ncbi:hypothetical protein [Phenylobacterium sp.]|uniref:hypothetical protein n=1 Tax=Phenylobacterium sp. TaxID=1871053 RepID=UPI0025E554A0|nr:hypothetical protein [Phenylobacterium sp.]
MSGLSIWRTLGIAATRDRTAIRRAYAVRLKAVHPEDDAAGFQALRAAYEQALRLAAQPERSVAVEAAVTWDDAPPPVPAAVAPAIDRVSREEIDVLDAALARLRDAVTGPAADRDAARAAFRAVVAARAMDAVSVRSQVEAQVGRLILQGGLVAAAIVDPAIAEFGWSSDRLAARSDLGAMVLARREDIALLLQLQAPSSPRHGAFVALTRKPVGARQWRNRLTPGLPNQVRALLELIYGSHRSLIGELDSDAVEWWSTYLRTPQLGPGAIWSVVAAPFVIAPLLAEGELFGLGGWPEFVAAYAVAVAGVAVVAAVSIFGLARGRARWRQTRAATAPAWLRYGWAPVMLANLAAAAGAAPFPRLAWAFALVVTIGFAWAAITAEPDRNGPVDMIWSLPFAWLLPFLRIRTMTPRWLLLSFGLIPLALVWSAIAPELGEAAVLRMAAPLYLAAGAFVTGHHSLEAAWRHRLSPTGRRMILVAAGLLASTLPLILWRTAPDAAYAPLIAAAVAAMVLLERIVSLGWDGRGLRDKLFHWGGVPALFAAVIAEEDARQGNAFLLFGGLWLMAGVAAGLIGALRRERVEMRQAAS